MNPAATRSTIRAVRRRLTHECKTMIYSCTPNASRRREDGDDPEDRAEIAKLDRLIARLGEVLRSGGQA